MSEAEPKDVSAETPLGLPDDAGVGADPAGPEGTGRPSVCLAMIVRNEAAVIERCLDSVRPLVDRWVICDTGSDDDTPERVERALARLPGQLHRRPWRDFAQNRTELLELARESGGDYLLLMDADMTVEAEPGVLDHLEADAYMLPLVGDMTYWMPYLVKAGLPWRYVGSTHETIVLERRHHRERLGGLRIHHHGDGGQKADKYTRDLALLTAEVERDPGNRRATFYLAQTYRDLGQPAQAVEWYRKRAGMGGWDQEVFYAKYQAASQLAASDWPGAVMGLVEAWEYRSTRAEPVHELAMRMRGHKHWHAAHLWAERGMEIPEPDDILFVSSWVYRFGLRFERSVAAYWTGRLEQALEDCEILAGMELKEPWRSHVVKNRQFCLDALAKRDAGGAEG